jgi:hypothetical protein
MGFVRIKTILLASVAGSLIVGAPVGRLSANAAGAASVSKPATEGLIREENHSAPRRTRQNANETAIGYIGQSNGHATKEDNILITDDSNPLEDLRRRPVWEVVMDDVDITVRAGEQRKRNTYVTRLSLLIDDETGALLKVFSPRPKTDGLTLMSRGGLLGRLRRDGFALKPATVVPKVSFTQALESASHAVGYGVADAKEVVGYYGLVTDNLNRKTGLRDNICWVVFLGGVKQRFPSSGPIGQEQRAEKFATEACVVVDADTGQWYTSLMTGK